MRYCQSFFPPHSFRWHFSITCLCACVCCSATKSRAQSPFSCIYTRHSLASRYNWLLIVAVITARPKRCCFGFGRRCAVAIWALDGANAREKRKSSQHSEETQCQRRKVGAPLERTKGAHTQGERRWRISPFGIYNMSQSANASNIDIILINAFASSNANLFTCIQYNYPRTLHGHSPVIA